LTFARSLVARAHPGPRQPSGSAGLFIGAELVERRNLTRATNQKTLAQAEAKTKVLELLAAGAKVEEAMRAVNRSAETYRDWRKNDTQFNEAFATTVENAGLQRW